MGVRKDDRRRPRIGLVLGAGGPVGHAFHAGVLHALESSLGWDPREAELVVGTSAGAQVAALLRAGMTGADLSARASGGALDDRAAEIARHFIRPCHKTPDPTLSASRRPASPAFLLNALREPRHLRPGRIASALLPQGRVRLDPQADGLRRIFGEAWPERETWITAVHLDSGRRVAFGAPGAPQIDMGTAVTCSSAVPGVYRPVEWGGLRYVDGGMASATHLDLLHDSDLDLVVVSSPLSMFTSLGALLSIERRRLERHVAVLTLEPTDEALVAMGRRPMDAERAPLVVAAAKSAVERALNRPKTAALLRLFAEPS